MSDPHETVRISSLLASRLCHDLVNPVGALNTGLEVFNEETDPEMREHAIRLIQESTTKTIALLSFARFAFGSSGAFEGELDMFEARKLALSLFEHYKAELKWELDVPMMPKFRARALLNMLLMAEKSVPRAGSTVTVSGDVNRVMISAEGPKIKYSDEVKACLAGESTELAAKETPAYLAYLLARSGGDSISADFASEENLIFTIAPAAS
ncbi:histidine phosphotransferase family protein [Parvularcula sp. LCG005]|uniref:histidine phosphotransferase family protein n=1 Tax=Parvularcula sp. LCG005 TaxID=3078805 RepID=UPI002943C48B|nr:histidine phosphotransferase family protein [Parvularcula sp. LCG005]WOI54446.1 histidine phosphotransferase family protein [Parvularcula sp. LCG005]